MFRALAPADVAEVRALVQAETGFTPYREPALAALESALGDYSDEVRARVAERAGEIVGVACYGLVPGSEGAGKLHLIAVSAAARLHGVATALVAIATDDLARLGARMIVAELPDDPVVEPGRLLLERCGFREESRVPDFYRDGTDLAIWRRDVTP